MTWMGVVASVGACTGLTVAWWAARRFVANSRALEDLRLNSERRIEERTRAFCEASSAVARAEKIVALGQLAAGVAHEINNPGAAVTANLSYLQVSLREGELPEDAMACLTESLEGMSRIRQIVRQMQDAGRTEASPETIAEVTEVARTVERAVAQVRSTLPGRAELSLAVPQGLHTRGSAQLLERILTILLVNAGQAIARKKGHGLIAVSAATEGEQVILEVRDDGCGMDAVTLERIFEPFFTTQPIGRGAGLGLSVAAGLVRSLGGILAVESWLGEGTCMRLRLTAGPLPETTHPLPSVGQLTAPRSLHAAGAGPRNSSSRRETF
jgi:signal transduction histidine kinase